METVIQQFRTSIGGFNRRDVQQYIENLSSQHRREKMALEKQLAEAQSRISELEGTMAGLETEKGSVAAEEARIREHLEESTRTLAKLRGEQTDTQSRLAAARHDLERYRAQVEELTPMAESYQQLKDRVATVELDAHRKAQAVIDDASAEAERIREQTRLWLSSVLVQYNALRAGMDGFLDFAKQLGLLEEQTGPLEEQAAELRKLGGIEK